MNRSAFLFPVHFLWGGHMCARSEIRATGFRLENKDYYIAALLVFICFILSYFSMVEGVCGVFHDDGIYVATAKSIADGTGYRLINIPSSPVQTKYPFLYPAMLAIIWKFYPNFPDNLTIMQIGSAVFGALGAGLAYLYLVDFDYGSRWIIFLSAILTISSPVFQFYSTLTLSEMPFFFFIVIALWILERQRQSNHRAIHQIAAGIVLSLPFLCRTVGIVIPIVAFLLLRRRLVEKKCFFLGIGLGCSVWPIWILLNSGNEPDLVLYYTSYFEYWHRFGSHIIFDISYNNFISFIFSLLGLNFPEIYNIINKYCFIIIFFIGLATTVRIIFDTLQDSVLARYLLFYLLIIMIWPWPVHRFIVPVLIFINLYMLNFSTNLISSKFRTLYIIPFVLMIFINIYNYPLHIDAVKKFNYPSGNMMGSGVEWNNYVNLFDWIKKHTEKSDIVSSGMDTMVFLYTERQSIRPFWTNPIELFYSDGDEPLGNIKQLHENLIRTKTKYLIQTPMPGFSEEKPLNLLIDRMIEFRPDFLKRVYIGSDPRFVVYEINQS